MPPTPDFSVAMPPSKKDQIRTLLKGIETGDPKAVEVVNEAKYIQRNRLTKEGNIGLAELFKRLAKTSPKVEVVRAFEDGDFVFAHTDYDFNVVEIGFEVFRFEDGKAVEHWDNLQSEPDGPNESGHTMIDGATEAEGLELIEANRIFVRDFITKVLMERNFDQLGRYVSSSEYTESNPNMKDGLDALRRNLANSRGERTYDSIHRILAEGNFVLCVSEGSLSGVHSSFYDLFRLANRKIEEHWDTTEEVPPRSEWLNENGKF